MTRNIFEKAVAALRDKPEWTFVLAYDELHRSVLLFLPPPWSGRADDFYPSLRSGRVEDMSRIARRWERYDAIALAARLQRLGIWAATPAMAAKAAELVAREVRSFHPVRSYLASIAWDGAPRIHTWLSNFLGAEDTPHVRDVGSRWLVSAVARVMRPGCKVADTLVLESPRLFGLSEALHILGGLWCGELVVGVGTKDAMEDIRGTWIVEVTDAEDVTAAQARRLKAFIARRSDERRQADRPRQCVFAITGRRLGDGSGGWRPIRCGKIDLDALRAGRDQLWAEAHAKYKADAL